MPLDLPANYDAASIVETFHRVRTASEALARPLSPEDCMLQSMEEASPVKWNLAHTTWFFETFILCPHAQGYAVFHPDFSYLFNSYYNRLGEMHPRPTRGLISRPGLDDVYAYRAHVNEALTRFLEKAHEAELARITPLLALGCAHEEQHQELLLTDLQHAMSFNPARPVVYENSPQKVAAALPLQWVEQQDGLFELGWNGKGFAFDNEGPRHKVHLKPYSLASRPATNGDYLEFMEDGGYENPDHWLSDGWDCVCREGWEAPLYWRKADGAWRQYSLFGEKPVDPYAPLSHVSYYEAAAYASWTGARLPTEFEWEAAATSYAPDGNLMRGGAPQGPRALADGASEEGRLFQLYGDVWEWTASAYLPYPGFRAPEGAVGEYNGKFMSGQMVLKGGSWATPAGHMRATYRNFFPPSARWQVAGLRLARDLD